MKTNIKHVMAFINHKCTECGKDIKQGSFYYKVALFNKEAHFGKCCKQCITIIPK